MRWIIFTVVLLAALPALARPGYLVGTTGEFSIPSAPTALSTLVASMDVGDWAELTTTGITDALGNPGGSNQQILVYMDCATWDPTSKGVYAVGSDHVGAPGPLGYQHFVRYREEENTWDRLPSQSFFETQIAHGYDHSTIDASRGEFYYTAYNTRQVRQYNIGTATWTALPEIPLGLFADTPTITYGTAWFPELDALIVFNERTLLKWDRTSNTWSAIDTASELHSYHTLAEYNPVHQTILFGGGNGAPRKIYKLDSSGTVTALSDAPINLGITGISQVLTVDPVSGDYLVFNTDNTFWKYNITTDTWTQLPDVTGDAARSGTTSVIGTPVSTHGVVFFAYITGPTNGHVWIYKHAE